MISLTSLFHSDFIVLSSPVKEVIKKNKQTCFEMWLELCCGSST